MKRSLLAGLLSLMLVTVTVSACSGASSYRKISFDTNTSYKTNNVLEQTVKVGGKVKKPAVSITEDNPDNLKVYAWYTDKDMTDEWDFKHDTVTDNMTLYAEWKKTYTVNYYLEGNTEPENTLTVYDGETVKEHPEYAIGFEYLGSYTDPEFQNAFDYSAGIHANTDIYMHKSAGIDVYEENPAGGLYDNLEMFSSTDRSSTSETPIVGSVSRTSAKDAVYLDFGYSPDVGDPFVEFNLNCDITHSQVIHFVMKHYGLGDTLVLYFTTLLDNINYNYSVTGVNYSENFTVTYHFQPDEIGMSEDDDYVDIAIDLAANSYYDGYSVWGTSPYLGRMRIQPTYISKDASDRSNTMLLKRIYGTDTGYENGVVTEDSQTVKNMLSDSGSAPTQDDLATGFVFPKDSGYVETSDTADFYRKDNGLLMHFENEIAMREKEDSTQSVSIVLPTDPSTGDVTGNKIVGLENNRNLYFTLTNYGYATSMNIVITNDYGGKTFTTVKLDRKMLRSKTYSINLSKESLMIHTLVSVTFEYEAVGVDNAILLENLYFGETKPMDIPGISFDDKSAFGLYDTTGATDIAYSAAYSGIEFTVNSEDSVILSSKTDISMTDVGYYGLSLAYSRSKTSEVEGVYVSLMINGAFGSEYYLETTSVSRSTTQTELNLGDAGTVTNIRFRFRGTGTIRFNSLNFVVSDDYCFSLSSDMSSGIYSDWNVAYSYSYDDTRSAMFLVADSSASSWNLSFYLGIGHAWYGNVYNCQNLTLKNKSKIVVVYQNPDDACTLTILPAYSDTVDGNPDGESYVRDLTYLNLEGHMSTYEWAAVTTDLPAGYEDLYLGKISFRGYVPGVYIRMIAVI